MNTFLTKISQLPSIQDVLLLSLRGELLFSNNNKDTIEADGTLSLWNAIISGLKSPVEADLFFEKGVYSLCSTGIGYVIVGMNGSGRLEKIKGACSSLQIKLKNPETCRKILLKMLKEADEALKPQFVKALLPFADDEIASHLIVLLGKEGDFSHKTWTKLFINICQVLGQCNSIAAQYALKKILLEHGSNQITLGNEAKYAAQVALAELELNLPLDKTACSPENKHTVNVTFPEDQYSTELPERQQIQDLEIQGRKEEAVALILAQIKMCAHKKQFDLAEKLRERLIQVDENSIREIIRAAEIIEEEKKASISEEYLNVWSRLASALSTDDFSSLYHEMVHRSYNNGETIVAQGEFLATLFFVNSGRVQLFSASRGGEYALKVVEAGEIFGAETFFDISIWTMSARSLGADLSLLTWDRLLRLKESNPALRTKLMDFSSQFKLTNTIFNRLVSTRRQFDRIQASGRVSIALLKGTGEENILGKKGNLLDISRGGLAFSLRFSKKKNAVALLGQNLRVSIRGDISTVSLQKDGVVKSVQCHDYVGNDYAIHMEFGETLSDVELVQVVGRK